MIDLRVLFPDVFGTTPPWLIRQVSGLALNRSVGGVRSPDTTVESLGSERIQSLCRDYLTRNQRPDSNCAVLREYRNSS